MLGEVAFHDRHLAAPAHGPAPANRIHVDAQLPGGRKHIGAERKAPAPVRKG